MPAISRWGIFERSPIIGTPDIFFPNAIGNFVSLFLNCSSKIISFKKTFSLFKLGISIPMVLFPGIVATLVDTELVFLAISSAKPTIFETFIPEAGSNSFKVTTGPELIPVIFPSTPKSNSIFSKNSEFLLSSALSKFFLFLSSELTFKKFIEGSLKDSLIFFVSLVSENGKIG